MLAGALVVGLLTIVLCTAGAGEELATPAPTAAEEEVSSQSGSVFTAVNFAVFGADAQVGSFYAFISGAIGLPAVSKGDTGATVAGAGFTRPITGPGKSRWFIDLFGELTPGWNTDFAQFGRREVYVGFGAGVGLRFLHRSGFTIAFKLPLIGWSVGPGAESTRPIQSGVSQFFIANLIALPIVSFGYRFEGT